MKALITDSSGYLYHAWLASASLPPEQTKQLLDEYRTPENIFHEFKSGSRPEGIAPAGIKALVKNASDQNLATLDGLLTLAQNMLPLENTMYFGRDFRFRKGYLSTHSWIRS